ncbi:hypothetical protein SHIRM173S_10125 [Streptomyces hirsutus]
MAWQLLPLELEFGSGQTCRRRLQRWQQAGVFDQLHRVLLAELNAAGELDWSRACGGPAVKVRLLTATVPAVFQMNARALSHPHGIERLRWPGIRCPRRRRRGRGVHRRAPNRLGWARPRARPPPPGPTRRCPRGGRDLEDGVVEGVGDGHADRVRQSPAPLREPGDERVGAAGGVGTEQCLASPPASLRQPGQSEWGGFDGVGCALSQISGMRNTPSPEAAAVCEACGAVVSDPWSHPSPVLTVSRRGR